MSFILDALKKSEVERQRKSTPGVADIPDARAPSRTPRWLWALAGLLAVNFVVLVVILLRPGAGAGTASITQPVELPDNAPPAASFSDLVAEAKESRKERDAATPPPGNGAPQEPGPAARTPAPRSAPVAGDTASPSGPVDIGTLATFQELRARGDLMLPDLHVDLHVYAERPADRFVIINMARYKEGATLAEGPVVKRILPNGAVLGHQGTEFFLPRP